MNKRNLAIELDRISSDQIMSETDRLVAAFGIATKSFMVQSERDLELARAMGDVESAVKEQIKRNVMQSARELFEFCYLNVTGTRKGIWDEQDKG